MRQKLAQAACLALVEELELLHGEIVPLLTTLSDSELWTKPADPGNSPGHLVLHLTGNLNHFVGAHLAKTGYVRDREREFSEDVLPPRAEMLTRFEAAVSLFRQTVSGLSEEQLLEQHPEGRFGSVLKTLVHLVAHFALHRGQISYLVRWIKSQAQG